MNRRIAKISIVAALAACFSTGAFAQQSPEETAIKYRQGVIRVIGWNFDPMGAMEKMQKEVAKLAQVSKSGDEAAMKTQFGEVGKGL